VLDFSLADSHRVIKALWPQSGSFTGPYGVGYRRG
jgi:hypothetical protein